MSVCAGTQGTGELLSQLRSAKLRYESDLDPICVLCSPGADEEHSNDRATDAELKHW